MDFECGYVHMQVAHRCQKRTLDTLWLSCKKLWASLSRCWELKSSPLQVESTLLTIDPSLKYQ